MSKSRMVYSTYGDGAPDVTSWAHDDSPGMAVALAHSRGDERSRVSVTTYLSREAARLLARRLNAAVDAIEADEARARNLALALPEPTP